MHQRIDNLVIVAHPDDEVLGFGGTGCSLVKSGQSVQAVILCGDVDARAHRPDDSDLLSDILEANKKLGFNPPVLGTFPNIRMNCLPQIDLVQFIESQLSLFKPTRVFTHHPRDLNIDHQCVVNACLAAVRLGQRNSDIPMIQSVHCMEIPSSTDWSFPIQQPPFDPNTFFCIRDTLETKINSLACYTSVMRDFPHPRSTEAIQGLAALRGGQSGFVYAEAFQTIFQRGF